MKVLPLLAGLLLAACSASTPAGDIPARTTSRDLLTADEIKTIDAQTAYDAIKRLRPRFLTPGQNRTPPVVYINGRKTDLRELTTLRAEEIVEVRYYEPGEATTRYGTGHLGGALEIKLGTPPGPAGVRYRSVGVAMTAGFPSDTYPDPVFSRRSSSLARS